MGSKLSLGGDGLANVIQSAEDAQQLAATGGKDTVERRRKRALASTVSPLNGISSTTISPTSTTTMSTSTSTSSTMKSSQNIVNSTAKTAEQRKTADKSSRDKNKQKPNNESMLSKPNLEHTDRILPALAMVLTGDVNADITKCTSKNTNKQEDRSTKPPLDTHSASTNTTADSSATSSSSVSSSSHKSIPHTSHNHEQFYNRTLEINTVDHIVLSRVKRSKYIIHIHSELCTANVLFPDLSQRY